MKRLLLSILLILAAVFPTGAFAGYVNGYYKSNGTYVNGYYRSEADGNPYNNYSFPGNTNPYTGKTAGGNPDTYLRNYYDTTGSTGSGYSGGAYYSPALYTSTYGEITQIAGGSKQYGIATCNYGYKKNYILQSCDPVVVPLNATMNILGDGFNCNSGYKLNYLTNQCDSIAPANARVDASTYQGWTCNSGYRQEGLKCIPYAEYCTITFGQNTYTKNDGCYCSAGYTFSKALSQCIKVPTSDEQCMAQYGANTYGIGNADGSANCYCNVGYKWDVAGTKCVLVINTPKEKDLAIESNTLQIKGQATSSFEFTKDLSIGMRGDDVVALQNILIKLGHLSEGSNSGYFGKATKQALVKYQSSVELPASGYFGAMTRARLTKKD